MAQLEHAPFRPHLSCIRSPHAGDAIEQFLLSLALQGRDSEHLTAIDSEGDTMQRVATRKVADFERRGLARRFWTGGASSRRRRRLRDVRAQHEVDDRLFGAL